MPAVDEVAHRLPDLVVGDDRDLQVLAGEQVIYDVELLHLRPEGASVQGRVSAVAAGQELAAATPVGEAEIFFAHLDKSRSQQLFGDHNFVFSGELKYMLGLAKLASDRKDSGS